MVEPKRTALSVRAERAVLLGVSDARDRRTEDEFLEELEALAKTVRARVVAKVVQHLPHPHPRTFVGTGKAEELRDLAKAVDADVIIANSDLSPAQVRNLEEVTDTKVVDRSELILDIFATHARSKQARTQVELAQLEYTYPRLTRMWSHLSRYEGGIGTRGPGETQLETDRRLVMRRIRDLKRDLRTIDRRRQQEVAARRDEFKVSIVGYTNAGKSTLMNALTDAGVLVQDQLFATLDTRTRRWDLDGHGAALLSDTVGFIRRLPHHLVESFKATLEEATHADLLLHVVDVSRADAIEQADAVMGVLADIGCADKRILTVFNKIDAGPDETALLILGERFPGGIAVSALRGDGLGALTEAVAKQSSGNTAEIRVTLSPVEGRLAAFLHEHGEVISRRDDEEGTHMHVRLHRRHLGQLAGHPGVEMHLGADGETSDEA